MPLAQLCPGWSLGLRGGLDDVGEILRGEPRSLEAKIGPGDALGIDVQAHEMLCQQLHRIHAGIVVRQGRTKPALKRGFDIAATPAPSPMHPRLAALCGDCGHSARLGEATAADDDVFIKLVAAATI